MSRPSSVVKTEFDNAEQHAASWQGRATALKTELDATLEAERAAAEAGQTIPPPFNGIGEKFNKRRDAESWRKNPFEAKGENR